MSETVLKSPEAPAPAPEESSAPPATPEIVEETSAYEVMLMQMRGY